MGIHDNILNSHLCLLLQQAILFLYIDISDPLPTFNKWTIKQNMC